MLGHLPGKTIWVQISAAAVCVAVGYVVLMPFPASACMVASVIVVGPALAAVIAGLFCTSLLLMWYGMMPPPWLFGMMACSTYTLAWATPMLRRQLQFRIPSSRLCAGIAAFGPILAGVMILVAVFFRVDNMLPRVGWGTTLLVFGLSQRCQAGGRIAALRRTVACGGACLLLLLLTGLLIETGLRVAMRVAQCMGGSIGAVPAQEPVVPHPRRFFTYAPNASGKISFEMGPGKTGQFSYRISRHGLRGRDYPAKAEDELRVITLGDSYAFGWGLDESHTIEAVLEKSLEGVCAGKRITVINAGVWGYSVWQERDLLNETGFALEPDIVVHLLYPSNDIDGAWERRKTFPKTHSVEWRQTLQPYMYRDNWRFSLQDTVLRHWRTLVLLKRAFPNVMDQPVLCAVGWLRLVPEYKLPRVPLPLDRPFELELNKTDWEPEVADAFTEMCGDITCTRDDCRKRGVAYAAAVVPAMASMREDLWNRAVRGYPSGDYVPEKDVRATEGTLAEAGIPAISLYGPLREANRTGETHYVPDGHFNPQGAMVVAETIRTALVSQYLP